MSRLPIPGSDTDTWGSILNDYLSVAHAADGTLVPGVVGAAQVADGAITTQKVSTAMQASLAKADASLPTATANATFVLTVNSVAPDGSGNVATPAPAWGSISGALSNQTDVSAAIAAKLDATGHYTAPLATSGYYQLLNLDFGSIAGGSAPEPIMVQTNLAGTYRRGFWVNENGSPRGAAVNSEPGLKIFGPAADTSYTGLVAQFLSRWNGASDTQRHLWGIRMDGNPIIGSGLSVGSNVIVLSASDSVPAGLPPGTVIVRTP